MYLLIIFIIRIYPKLQYPNQQKITMIHGQKKTDKKKSQQQVKQENQLTEKINLKLKEFFQIRNLPIDDAKLPTLLEFTTILMQLCDDIYTIFNYRRELIERLLTHNAQPKSQLQVLVKQIKLLSKIMEGNPKSYTLWSYRQWLVLKIYAINPSIIKQQKQLCNLMLMKDEKNFHVWNYRNWLNNTQMNVDTELQFTKSKINTNPFNFSAYHFRSKYLIWKYSEGSQENLVKQEIVRYGMPRQIFNSELQTVKTAIFLNPKQQAPWLFYSWLLKQLLPSVLLKFDQVAPNKFILLFSLKIQKPTKLFQTNKTYSIKSQISPSKKWQIQFDENIDSDGIKLVDNLDQICISNQLNGRRVISSNKQNYSEVQEVYEKEQSFIKEVLESEQNQCRFAWLQLLDLYKSKLYLGQDWEKITEKASEVFLSLQNEQKGKKYIQKQRQQWIRLKTGQLSDTERELKAFRNKK